MAIKVISDLHGEVDALRMEVQTSDTLLLLGDLVNIIDYSSMDGILVDIFGTEAVEEVIALRAKGLFDEARSVMAKRREGRETEVAESFRSLVSKAYKEVFDSLPRETYLILGNVDWPQVVDEVFPDSTIAADGQVFELRGLSFGFVGGGLPTPLHIAGEITEEEYNAKLDSLGEVDVVCSHVPPDIPELTFDILAQRHERGSSALVDYIKRVQPMRVFFGHIHQPLLSSMHIGKTHCVNAGYFRRTRRAVRFWAD